MTGTDVLAVRMAHAYNKAVEVLEEHGAAGSEPEERIQRIKESTRGSVNYPVELASFQAEVTAALAELADSQAEALADLTKRVADLEAQGSAK